MTNKELFVEYLKMNNLVPQDFNESDLPSWDVFNMEAQQPWGYYDTAAYPYMDDIAQRYDWNRPDWRGRPYNRPGYPWYGPGFNRPFMPILWWWLLFS